MPGWAAGDVVDGCDDAAVNSAISRVFVSYSHESEEHTAAVLRLHDLLRSGGIEAILDRYFTGPGRQWLEWMEQQIRAADFVVVIASPGYGRRAADDVDVADIVGRGTWYEARLLRDLVYRDEGRESLQRILPVLLPGGSVEDLPAFFAPYGGTYFQVRELTPSGVADLLRVLRRESGPPPVAIGGSGVAAGFVPLREDVSVDVSLGADGLTCQVSVSGRVLGVRRRPMPVQLAGIWSVLELSPVVAGRDLAAAGDRLSAALLDPAWLGEVTELVDRTRAGTGVEVVFTSEGAGLALPFELLRLGDERVWCTVGGVRFSRRVRGVDRPYPKPSAGPLKILAAVAAPEESRGVPLDVEAEMQAIVNVATEAGRAQVSIVEVASPGQITAALRRDAYHVLHLSAHGWAQGVELEDEDGHAIDVDAQGLVEALKHGDHPVPLLVLSSCAGAARGDAGLAALLVRHGLDRVIAMQAAVSDRYATALLGRVYAELAETNPPVGVALARARYDLYAQAMAAREPVSPEYAVATLLTGCVDAPLCDPTASSEPLSHPVEAPVGGGVRELALGELIGRRAQLRQALRLLRDDPAAVAEHGATCGVVLTGIGGIGKTALAGRIMSRLREDPENPWRTAVHVGRFTPPVLLAAVAHTVTDPRVGAALADPKIADLTKLRIVEQLLHHTRLLLVFDDFEQNLTEGGDAFSDPGFAEVFTALCQAAGRGRLLVTSRHPVPGADDLATVEVPPLSRAELGRLLMRLPMLRELTGGDRKTIIDTVGGHPRLIEFVDALMRGHAGRARMTEVAVRLRALAEQEQLTLTQQPHPAPDAAEAARQAILLGSRDILLNQLLDLLTPSQRECLLQAALSRTALARDDLSRAVYGDAGADNAALVDADTRRLRNLTLLTGIDTDAGQLIVHSWVREALAPYQGEHVSLRHERGAAMRYHRLNTGQAVFDDLPELAGHLAALHRFDELATFALSVSDQIAGELGVAAFLGDVLASFPREHPLILALIDREREALANTGNSTAASQRAEELLAIARARHDADPGNVQLQRDLSVSYERLADLAVAAGDPGGARTLYDQSLSIARRLAEADPGNVQLQRDLSVSYNSWPIWRWRPGIPAAPARCTTSR